MHGHIAFAMSKQGMLVNNFLFHYPKVKGLIIGCSLMFLGGCEPVTTVVTTVGGVVGIGVLEERSAEDSLRDKHIQLNIHLEINRQNLSTGNEIFVLVYEQEAMLAGFVQNDEQVSKIEAIAKNTQGVRRQYNELRSGKISTEMYVKDRALGVEVSTRLSLEKGVHAVNYTIRIVDGIAYMMGLALSSEELNRVRSIISSIVGIRGIVSQVRVRAPQDQHGTPAPASGTVPSSPNLEATQVIVPAPSVQGIPEDEVEIKALEPIN